MNKITKGAAVALLTLFATGLTGCKTPQDVAYFQDNVAVLEAARQQPIKIKPGDKLIIVVKSKDPAVSNLFNLGIYSTRVGDATGAHSAGIADFSYRPSGNDGLTSYTVSPSGMIDFPVLGNLRIEGMTRSELAGYIKGELMGRDLVKDPQVTVEFVNTGVNIMGEVVRPGRYDINKDELNILEALSMAGDLSLNGQRKNVRVIREENGKVQVYTLDLTDLGSLTASPAYYLQQDDLIYVEPNDMRKRATSVNGNNVYNVSFWISVASLITTAVTTVGVFVNK